MQHNFECRYQAMMQAWENRVRQGPLPDWQEQSEFAEAIGREFCRLPDWYGTIMNPENETSFLHTFGEAIYAFYVFCLKMKEVVIWPAKALRQKVRMTRQ